MIGLFKWKTGVPTKDGSYLVMHKDHRGVIIINHDVWIEERKKWQSQFIGIIAWCCFEDIHTTSQPR